MISFWVFAESPFGRAMRGCCHTNLIPVARKLEVPTRVQAAVAARHVRNASSLRIRSVRREVR
jgi:hypothetical protein